MANNMEICKRSEQNPEVCWTTADLYPNDEAWEAEFAACQVLPGEMAAYEGRLGSCADTLLEFLQRNERDLSRSSAL